MERAVMGHEGPCVEAMCVSEAELRSANELLDMCNENFVAEFVVLTCAGENVSSKAAKQLEALLDQYPFLDAVAFPTRMDDTQPFFATGPRVVDLLNEWDQAQFDLLNVVVRRSALAQGRDDGIGVFPSAILRLITKTWRIGILSEPLVESRSGDMRLEQTRDNALDRVGMLLDSYTAATALVPRFVQTLALRELAYWLPLQDLSEPQLFERVRAIAKRFEQRVIMAAPGIDVSIRMQMLSVEHGNNVEPLLKRAGSRFFRNGVPVWVPARDGMVFHFCDALIDNGAIVVTGEFTGFRAQGIEYGFRVGDRFVPVGSDSVGSAWNTDTHEYTGVTVRAVLELEEGDRLLPAYRIDDEVTLVAYEFADGASIQPIPGSHVVLGRLMLTNFMNQVLVAERVTTALRARRRIGYLKRKLGISPIPAVSVASQSLKSAENNDDLRSTRSLPLAEGKSYVRVRVRDWSGLLGQYLRVYCRGQKVYGNIVEQPAKGEPLEYRNIVGPSTDPQDYCVNLPVQAEITCSPVAFTTPQQNNFDEKYHVEQHGDVFYSVRGNTANPRKVIFTFAGCSTSTSPLQFVISYLGGITDSELDTAALVAFQDRYLVAGSYMTVGADNEQIDGAVDDAISSLLRKWKINENNVLFFGASKGGSIALRFAAPYPRAAVVCAVPQMNRPYYFTKPAFRENLGERRELATFGEPSDYFNRYLSEGRSVDLFYTTRDEISNFSVVEFPHPQSGLRTHRIDGIHTDVARRALPTMLGRVRTFLRDDELPASPWPHVRDVTLSAKGALIFARVELASVTPVDSPVNWYLERSYGEAVRRYELQEEDGVLVTPPTSGINTAYETIRGLWSLRYISERGETSCVPLAQWPQAFRSAKVPHGRDVEGPSLLQLTDGAQSRYRIGTGMFLLSLMSAT